MTNWYKIAKKEDYFILSDLEKNFWNTILKKEKDRVNIHFDLENNDSAGDIKFRDLEWQNKSSDGDFDEFRVYAQEYRAGGDWETPVAYFRCQIAKKYHINGNEGNWDKG